jgi:outer membrane immunogenic protein
VIGGHAGYNWQVGRWVAGLEVDGSATHIRGDSAPVVRTGVGFSVTDGRSDDVRYLGTARARVGGLPFAAMDVLLYGTAGLAWERDDRFSTRTTVFPPVTGIQDTTTPRDHFGWVGGVGGEFRIGASNWVGRVEYLHYDFGMVEQVRTSTGGAVSFAENGGRQTIDVVRGGLSYKFDAPSLPLSAYAASLPVKALPPASWSWAGFYIGAHGGYGWMQNDFAILVVQTPDLIGGIDSRGWVLGGHAGYNWQSGRWVTGFEIDGTATRIRGDSAAGFRDAGQGASVTNMLSDDVQYLGSVRARVGGVPFSAQDIQLYGTAGLAWERANRIRTQTNVNPPTTQVLTTTTPRDQFGWVAGAGGEFRIGATNWIGRVEYLHYDFGAVETASTVTSNIPGGSRTERGGPQTIDIVRGGLSYKLDAASSPLSAYASVAPATAALPPATWSWAGFYIGGHGGYGWKNNDFVRVAFTDPLQTFDGIKSQGGVFGGQAGYNWQFGRWVAGLELDGSASHIRGETAPLFRDVGNGNSSTTSLGDDVKYLGSVRARVGGAPVANVDAMFYGTAGLAWERLSRVTTTLFLIPPSTDFTVTRAPQDRFGWVSGIGGEFRLGASNWIGRIEYLHYDFGSVETKNSANFIGATGSFADATGRQTIDVVRGGVSYKFAATE